MENSTSNSSILYQLLELIDWDVFQGELNDYRKVLGLISHVKLYSVTKEANIHFTNGKKINCVQKEDHILMSGELQGSIMEKKINSQKDCINFLKLFV